MGELLDLLVRLREIGGARLHALLQPGIERGHLVARLA